MNIPSRYYIMHSGTRVYPNDISSFDINLQDIAHHLTNIQRFGGALPFDIKYSVAEHSINLCRYALDRYGDQSLGAACLLHDASEAYLGDVVSPLKTLLKDYKKLEWDLMDKIQKKYSIDFRYDTIVSYFDQTILRDEVRCLMPSRLSLFPAGECLGIKIKYNQKQKAVEEEFLGLCKELNIQEE